MKRKIVGLVSIFFMALMLAIPMGTMAAEDTIKLVDVAPLSGPVKDIGDRYLEGTKYAIEIINKNGGLLGKKVELISIDSEYKPDVATRKAQTVILKEGAKFFHVPAGTHIGIAVLNLAEKNDLLIFTSGVMSASLTGANCNKRFFRVCGTTDQYSYALANAIVKEGHKKIAIIAQDYSFGHEAVVAFKKKLAELDPSTKIVSEIFHPIGTKDFAPYVSQFIAAKPDAIFSPNFGNDMTIFLKQGRPMGMKQKVFSYFNGDEVVIAGLGNDDLIEGNVGVETYYLTIPTKKNAEFVAQYHKDVGNYPAFWRAKAYLAVMFWAEAVKKAGTTDVTAVRKAWEGLTYDSPAGLWTMRACDHQLQSAWWYAKNVKKNKFYKHAYVDTAQQIPAKEVTISCEDTGCKMSQ